MASNTFLAISDIHFNPFDGMARNPDLTEFLAKPAADWPGLFDDVVTAYDNAHPAAPKLEATLPGSRDDANYLLMKDTFDHAARTAPDVDFIIYPGDFLRHDIWGHLSSATRLSDAHPDRHPDPRHQIPLTTADHHDFITKMVEVVILGLQKRFPGKPIFMTFGNDDSYRSDYQLDSDFLNDMGALCQSALGSSFDQAGFTEFASLGCYAATLPVTDTGAGTKTRMLSISNVAWSHSRMADPQAESGNLSQTVDVLGYLDVQLAAAASAGDKVWLLMHIPPFDACHLGHGGLPPTPNWNSHFRVIQKDPNMPPHHIDIETEFQAMIDKHDVDIEIAFCGHTHMDDFRFGTHTSGGADNTLMYKIVPAISPKFGQNPSFQIYTTANGVVSDWTTHYRESYVSGADHWTNSYSASADYGYVDPSQLHALFTTMLDADDPQSPNHQQASADREMYGNDFKVRRHKMHGSEIAPFVQVALGLPVGVASRADHDHADRRPIEEALAVQAEFAERRSA